MKNFILLIISTVIFTPAFATNEIEKKESESPKVQNTQFDNTKKEENTEFFGNLRKSNSSSNNSLSIGSGKQDSHNSGAEICNVANKSDDGKNGAGLCGMPTDKSQEVLKNKPSNKPS